MEGHVKALGWIYIVTSVLTGLFIMMVMTVASIAILFSGEKEALIAIPFVAIGGFGFILFMVVPGLAGGIGLLKYKRWARVVILVLGVMGLFNIPIGTALGVYALYVLLHHDAESLFSPYTYRLPGDLE